MQIPLIELDDPRRAAGAARTPAPQSPKSRILPHPSSGHSRPSRAIAETLSPCFFKNRGSRRSPSVLSPACPRSLSARSIRPMSRAKAKSEYLRFGFGPWRSRLGKVSKRRLLGRTYVRKTITAADAEGGRSISVSDQLADCRRFRVLNNLSTIAAGSVPGPDRRTSRSPAPGSHGSSTNWRCAPACRRRSVLDNGPERLPARRCSTGRKRTGVRLRFIEPGKPVQNAFVESLNGKLRGTNA